MALKLLLHHQQVSFLRNILRDKTFISGFGCEGECIYHGVDDVNSGRWNMLEVVIVAGRCGGCGGREG